MTFFLLLFKDFEIHTKKKRSKIDRFFLFLILSFKKKTTKWLCSLWMNFFVLFCLISFCIKFNLIDQYWLIDRSINEIWWWWWWLSNWIFFSLLVPHKCVCVWVLNIFNLHLFFRPFLLEENSIGPYGPS